MRLTTRARCAIRDAAIALAGAVAATALTLGLVATGEQVTPFVTQNPTTTDTTSTSHRELPQFGASDCEEDDPCWDCQTMGNRICGTEVPSNGR